MKTFRSTVTLLLVQICVSCFGMTSLKDRPNILFIHVDQMHWEAMSAYGNPSVKTPCNGQDSSRWLFISRQLRLYAAMLSGSCMLVHRAYIGRNRHAYQQK